MNLAKASLLTGFSTLIRLITGFLGNKIVAVKIGPTGIATLGQFTNFFSIVMAFAGLGIGTGVTKYVAEYYDRTEERERIISTALVGVFGTSLIIGFLLFLFKNQFCLFIFHNLEYVAIFSFFPAVVVLGSMHSLFSSILNGEKDIKVLTVLNIISSFVGLAATIVFIQKYGIYGSLVGSVICSPIMMIVILFFIRQKAWFRLQMLLKRPDLKFIRLLSGFSLMTFSSALTAPFIKIILRDLIVAKLSWCDAGQWQGLCRLSEMYLLIITTSLGIYYLPRLSEIRDIDELKKEIKKGYTLILPPLAIFLVGIYIFRVQIIRVIFAPAFLPMQDLFLFQLIGDFFKISSWLLGYVIVARAMVKWFIFSELVFSFSWLVFSVVFFHLFGLVGLQMGMCLNYAIYLLFMIWCVKTQVFNRGKLI